MRALHTAATGMLAQELNVQVISNNIANMRTTGYKRQRAEFQDLLYENVAPHRPQTSDQGNMLPAGIQLGSGVKTVGTPRIMTQGTLTPTEKDFDVAIRGEGFFRIQHAGRHVPPTRATARSSSTRRASIVTAQGYRGRARHHHPATTRPRVTINAQGQVSVTLAGQTDADRLGQLTLTRFVNKAGLRR